jgi:TonB-linked SusC/RagA family outer membrane protein
MKKLMLFLLVFCTGAYASAQTAITGVVSSSADGLTMPGVSVTVKGTALGTATDIDGNFSLTIPSDKAVLVFTYIGYQKKEVTVTDNSKNLTILLDEDTKLLDEVVVVGYGTMKKRDLSGAIGQIKGDDIMKGNPASSINQALQGKMAGVLVSQNDGAPGAGISITVRGTNSFSTSSQPLYIIDGVPFDVAGVPNSGGGNSNQSSNPLALINPHNIESIEVLKDASATAIYGSRGANGVILITTKKGESGNEKIEVSTNFNVSQIGKRVKVLGAYDYAQYINEQNINDKLYLGSNYNRLSYPTPGEWDYTYRDGKRIPTTGRYQPSPEDFLNPRIIYDSYGNMATISDTDWQDEIYQTGYSQEYNLQVSGGDSKGWHTYSGNYMDQGGIIVGSNYKRYALAANIGRKVHDWIELGLNINYTNSTTDFAKSNASDYSVIRSALMFPPTNDPHMDVSAVDELSWLAANPYIYVRTAKDQLTTNNVFTSSYLELTFTPWLKFRQNLGLSYNNNNRDTYYGRHTQEGRPPTNGRAGQGDNWWKGTTAESILTFYKTFGIHSLNVVAGFTYEEGNWGSKSISTEDFPSDVTGEYDLTRGLNYQKPSSGRGRQQLESFLGRVNYVLNDKYIFTASFRSDGSSKFAPENKWASFASGAFAWRLSEESFIKNLDLFSNLKLRLSFGQTGNQGVGSYETIRNYETANYSVDGTTTSGVAENAWRALNEKIRWETTEQYNAGLDFGFINNRINLTVDYYHKNTRDLLQLVILPPSTGFQRLRTNYAHVTNDGLELTGNFAILTGDFKWDMNANVSFNRNKIGGLDGDQMEAALWYATGQINLERNGCPIGVIYGYVEDGFYDNEAEVRAEKKYATEQDAVVKALVGEVKYRDFNGDGDINEKDRVIIGNTNPDFVYGLTNNLSWKGFNLSFFLQGTYGNDMFNANLMDVKLSNIGNITQDAYNTRWTDDNRENAKWPKATGGYNRVWRVSDRYIEDGSYLRLKNLSLGYTVPVKFKGIESLYVFGSATNLFTITNYSWFDPDVNAYGGTPYAKGVDLYSYPSSRTYSVGLKVTL